MKKLLLWLIILAALAGGGYGAYWWREGRTGPAAASYRTAVIKRADITSVISATGTVVPEDVVDVGSQVNGQIALFGVDTDGNPVDYRSTVEEGAVLARIDDALFAADVATSEAELARAKAAVRGAEAQRDQAKAKLDQSQRDWERARSLAESHDLAQADTDLAKSNFEQARASLSVAEAAIEQGHAAVAIAEAALLRSRRNLTYCTIKSPVSGVIIDRRVDIGQTVVASLNAPSLFLIAKDLSRMKVLVQVNEADIGRVHPGQPVTFTVDAFPDSSFKGEVRKVRLNATMTQNVVTYTVEIVTENKDLKLLPYLTANVRFEVARHENVLAVPGAALRWSPAGAMPASPTGAPTAGGVQGARPPSGNQPGASGRGARGSTVWVISDGRPRPVEVHAGLTDGSLTEVEGDGLAEGDQVVIGEQAAGAAPTASTDRSPFQPQMGGRRGR